MRDKVESIVAIHGESPLPAAVADKRLAVVWANRAALARYPVLAQPDGLTLLLPGGGLASLAGRLARHRLPLSAPLPLLDAAVVFTPVADCVLIQFTGLETAGSSLHPQDNELLMSSVTGQLRVPLSNIFAGVSSISRIAELCDNDRLLELAGLINENSYHLLRFTADLTDYLRGLSGETGLTLSRVDLRELLRSLCAAAGVITGTAGIALSVSLPEEPVLLPADPDGLLTALLHLISNACRYTRDGNRIDLSLSAGESTAVVTVSDRGLGIPAELTARVFEPFFSYDWDGRPYAGAGLGLTLVRYIAARHGGTVALTSAEGEGTTVALSLPLLDRGPLELRSPPRVADLLRDRYSPLHVLLSDSCGVPRP